MALTDQQIANIIFNETRSLSGEPIAAARKNIAHSIINAQAKSGKRPKTGPTVAHVPKQEGPKRIPPASLQLQQLATTGPRISTL